MVTCLYIVPLVPPHESLKSIDVFGLQQQHHHIRCDGTSDFTHSVAHQVE